MAEAEQQKEYVVLYESQEHWEVMGFIKADSLEEAKDKAQKELQTEAGLYNVTAAEIAELKDLSEMQFNIPS